MKIAYVHILPIEYYPPAINTLKLIAAQGWNVRAWTSTNERHLQAWQSDNPQIVRHAYATPDERGYQRLLTYLRWHITAARQLSKWQPDVLISVEPHSAIAVWLYYRLFRGRARLFIHHHEYYAPEDYHAPGMRLARLGALLERRYLFRRAEWISQTNGDRLGLLAGSLNLNPRTIRVLPNFPPSEWAHRAFRKDRTSTRPRKLIYLGSASLEDTFIGELAAWVANHPDEVSLSVVGNNISHDVWTALSALHVPNISLNNNGWDYDTLPEKLKEFDVGVVLYKGNTQNFIFNVPNKAIEYLAAGLEVWYPPQMRSMQGLQSGFPELPMTEIDFENIPKTIDEHRGIVPEEIRRHFTAESALQPLIDQIEHGVRRE
jgi:hypothetical protein